MKFTIEGEGHGDETVVVSVEEGHGQRGRRCEMHGWSRRQEMVEERKVPVDVEQEASRGRRTLHATSRSMECLRRGEPNARAMPNVRVRSTRHTGRKANVLRAGTGPMHCQPAKLSALRNLSGGSCYKPCTPPKGMKRL